MKPAKLEEVKAQMESRVYTVDFIPDMFEPSIAYVITPTNSTLGNVSQMYINSSDKELADFLFMHECGHILFGHQKDPMESAKKYLLPKIVAAFPRIKRFFPGNIRDCLNLFVNLIFNVAMDLEVNSRMFSREEFLFMEEHTKLLLKEPEATAEWPERYGLPLERTWNEYITMILLEPEKFIFLFRMNNALAGQTEDGKFKGVMTEKEFDELKKKLMSNRMEPSEMEKMRKKFGEKVEYGVPNGLMAGYDDIECEKNTRIVFTTYTSMPELLEELRKLVKTKKHNSAIRNQMYNANRKKHNSNVIIPKDLRTPLRYQKGDLFLLFDVSGSIDPHMVHDFLMTIKNVKNEFKNTQVVFWDTDYVSECTLEDEPPDLHGGGNDIAKGITYMNERFGFKQKDCFFVISDFYDDIPDWARKLKPLKCHKYAIDWSSEEHYENPGFEHIIKKSKSA